MAAVKVTISQSYYNII